MLTNTLATLAEALARAQLAALRKLTELLETSESPAETRRIAAAILRFRAPSPTVTPTEPAPVPPAQTPLHHAAPRSEPLSSAELEALALALPFVPVHKFKHENTPAYWRNALALHIQTKLKHAQPAATPARDGPAPAPA